LGQVSQYLTLVNQWSISFCNMTVQGRLSDYPYLPMAQLSHDEFWGSKLLF